MRLPTQVADAAGHVDPVASVVLALAVMLLAAKLGGDLALRLSQPAVLGELAGGALLGSLYLLGFTGFDLRRRRHHSSSSTEISRRENSACATSAPGSTRCWDSAWMRPQGGMHPS